VVEDGWCWLRPALSAAAIALTFIGYAPYVWSILKGRLRPHAFSWVIWGVTTFISFLAQLADGGGLGAWPIGVSGVIAIAVAVLSVLKRGDASITRSDWAFLFAALASLPVWLLTSEPLWASLILTAVDLLGFGPSFRKAWSRPHEDSVQLFVILAIRNALSIAALEAVNLTTLVFPLFSGLASAAFVALILVRRAALARAAGVG
jgi:hypothetical protein